MFGKSRGLSRTDIDDYQSNVRGRQSIEEKVMNDSFDNAALEGFSNENLHSSAMKDLDNRFENKFSTTNVVNLKVVWLSIAAASIISVIWWTSSLDETIQPTQITKVEEVDKLEEVLQEADQGLNEEKRNQEVVEENNQVAQSPTQINKEEEVQNTLVSDEMPANAENEELFNLPELSVRRNNKIQTSNELILYRTKGDELYIQEYKTVDYSKIRPDNPTKKNVSTGVPASQEKKRKVEAFDDMEQQKEVSYSEFLEEAITYLKNEDYANALAHFNTILEEYENDVNAYFYKGLTLYYMGDFEKSIVALDKSYTMELGNFYEEAIWFKALCLLGTNKPKAKETFERIVNEKGFYAEQAGERLRGMGE